MPRCSTTCEATLQGYINDSNSKFRTIDSTNKSAGCPWTGNISPILPLNDNECTCRMNISLPNEDTQMLPFSEPWVPPSSIDPTRNIGTGIYDFRETSDTNGDPGYELDVIPTFKNLTWTGNAIGCGVNGPDSCKKEHPNFNNIPWENRPYMWAGYTTDASKSGGITIPNNCENCESGGNLVLCTLDSQMIPKSCPGYSSFNIKPPKVINISDYYSGVTKESHPRGIGKCFYAEDTIQNDAEMSALLNLRRTKKIHSGLADNLAKKYCYTTIEDQECGLDSTGRPITKCTRMAVQQNKNSNSICKEWVNDVLADGKGIWIDDASKEWCNNPDNEMTPLCDCFKARYNNNTGIRNFYSFIKGYGGQIIKSNVPDVCWYSPCMANTYALKSFVDTCNIDVAQICMNVIYAPDADASIINDNKQSLNCNIEIKSENEKDSVVISNPGVTVTENGNTNNVNNDNLLNLLKNPKIYIPIIFIVVILLWSIIASLTRPTINNEYMLKIIRQTMERERMKL
jgi:hypothetical protein